MVSLVKKNTHLEVVTKSTLKRRFMNVNTNASQGEVNNRTVRLHVSRKHLKSLSPLHQTKREKEQIMRQTSPHRLSNMVEAVLWHGHVAANENRSLQFIDK